MTIAPAGIDKATSTRIGKRLVGTPARPVSTSTGSGTPAVYQPPTVAPPPSTVEAVMQQLDTSTQLAENTATGSGTGAGRTSPVVSINVATHASYLILGALGLALIAAFIWDRKAL